MPQDRYKKEQHVILTRDAGLSTTHQDTRYHTRKPAIISSSILFPNNISREAVIPHPRLPSIQIFSGGHPRPLEKIG